jgi:hypothetical protein
MVKAMNEMSKVQIDTGRMQMATIVVQCLRRHEGRIPADVLADILGAMDAATQRTREAA